MANDYYISAGLVPIDNSTGAVANSYYIAAGLVPDDTAAGGEGVDLMLSYEDRGTFRGVLHGAFRGC